MPDTRYVIDEMSVKDTWRVFRMMAELVEGFDELSKIGPAVSIFGTARATPSDPVYILAETIARKLAEKGFAVITGGGPGVMEAGKRLAPRPRRHLPEGILADEFPFLANQG